MCIFKDEYNYQKLTDVKFIAMKIYGRQHELVDVAKYLFIKCQWTFFTLRRSCISSFTWLGYKQQGRSFIRNRRYLSVVNTCVHPVLDGVCVLCLLVFVVVVFFRWCLFCCFFLFLFVFCGCFSLLCILDWSFSFLYFLVFSPIALSVSLHFTTSEYTFGIFQLFLLVIIEYGLILSNFSFQ